MMRGGELEQIARILKILLFKKNPIAISTLGVKASMPYNKSKPFIKSMEEKGFVKLSPGTIGKKKKMKVTFVSITRKGIGFLKDFNDLKKLLEKD